MVWNKILRLWGVKRWRGMERSRNELLGIERWRNEATGHGKVWGIGDKHLHKHLRHFAVSTLPAGPPVCKNVTCMFVKVVMSCVYKDFQTNVSVSVPYFFYTFTWSIINLLQLCGLGILHCWSLTAARHRHQVKMFSPGVSCFFITLNNGSQRTRPQMAAKPTNQSSEWSL